MENKETQYYKNDELKVHVKHDEDHSAPSLWVNSRHSGVISLNHMERDSLIAEGFVECSREEFDDAYNKIALRFIARRNTVHE